MKKIIFVIAAIALLSGCGTKDKTLTCTRDNTVGNITSKATYKIDYRNDDIHKMTVTYEYKDNHIDGVGTGTDGTTEDDNNDNNGIIDGVVGEALDDIVTGVTDTVLDISGIKTRHNTRFGTYVNTEGFTTMVDTDNDTDYKVTYTYDLDKLSDTNLANFGIDRSLEKQKKLYTDQGLTCK